MEIHKKYSLVKEHDKSFEIHDATDDKKFHVSKRELHPAHQIRIMKMKKYAEGGDVEEPSRSPASDDPSAFTIPDQLKPGYQPPAGEAPSLGDMIGDAGSVAKNWLMSPSGASLPEQSPTYANKAPVAPSSDQVSLGAPSASQPMMDVPQAAPPQRNPMAGFPTTGSLSGMQGQYEKSVLAGAKGQMEQNRQIAETMDPMIKAREDAQVNFQKAMQTYQTQADNLAKDISSQKIDPEHYFNSMDSGKKFRTGLAMILGGLAGGVNGTNHNAAMDYVQKAIDRDIESQKMELGKKQTLLSDNFRQQGNMIAAEAATRAQYESILQGKLQMLAAKTSNPMILAQAQQQIMDSRLRMMPMLQQVAQNQMVMGLMGNSNVGPDQKIEALRWLAPERAKEMESRYVPGVGFAQVPLTDTDRGQLASRLELNKATKMLEDFAAKNQGSLDPKVISYGHALAKQVQDMYRRANAQGVFKPAEAEFVEGIVAQDPTAFFAKYRTLPKYRALKEMNTMELQGLTKKVGLDVHPDFYGPAPTKVSNGVIYKKGPNGEAIPVGKVK